MLSLLLHQVLWTALRMMFGFSVAEIRFAFVDVGGLAPLAQELFSGDRSNPTLLSTLRNQAKLKDV